MTVVVNELEVVPAEAKPEQPAGLAAGSGGKEKSPVSTEVEACLRTRLARSERMRAY